ncbi:hypothetical protein BSL78_27219 [Apostichopus japonicus]|uniref:Pol-like protein n=1 Tax=Stichopus japonicus TaxID=307972 RepID=A0A2G8JJP6_STIJA|nr:hypothetical protein BSL78_27219 [Apostichopus japonicus]
MEVDCVCLQETHILEEDVPLWAYEWGGGCMLRLVRHPVALSSFCHLVRRVVPLGWRRITRADWFAFYSSIHRSDAGITELDRFTSAHLLADVWRHMHPCSTVYTWVRPNGEDASRIDRVYAPTYLDEKYHGARVRARVEAVEAEERPSLRFYQSVSSSAVTDASRLCALLMGPWLVTLTALSAYIKSIIRVCLRVAMSTCRHRLIY